MTPRITVGLFAILSVCSLFDIREARSRENWFGLTWDIAVPTAETKDFISEVGLIGFGAEGWSLRNPNISVGFVTGWQNLYEQTDEIIQIDNVTISGTQVRYIDFIPILIGTRYIFGNRYNRIRPFVGIKAGTYRITQRMDIGTVEIFISKAWHLGVAPEAGTTFLTPWMDIFGFVGADYNYAFSRKDSIDFSYLGISIGFMYVL
jgi:hypothetical protein